VRGLTDWFVPRNALRMGECGISIASATRGKARDGHPVARTVSTEVPHRNTLSLHGDVAFE